MPSPSKKIDLKNLTFYPPESNKAIEMVRKWTYVLDTSIMIYDPEIMYRLGDSRIVLPAAVVKELDGLKNSPYRNTGRAARKAARILDMLGIYGNLAEGVELHTGGSVLLYHEYEAIDDLASAVDNRVVGAAIRLKRKWGDVVLLTMDSNMRTVSRAHGVRADFYPDCPNEVYGKPDNEPGTGRGRCSESHVPIRGMRALNVFFGALFFIGLFSGNTVFAFIATVFSIFHFAINRPLWKLYEKRRYRFRETWPDERWGIEPLNPANPGIDRYVTTTSHDDTLN